MHRFEFNTRARRYRRYLGVALRKPLVGPQTVSLETTHHCNLRCSFCESHGILQETPITSRREYVGGRTQMDLETIRRVVRELADVGTDLVELSGKGDPIAHPDLTEIVKAIRDAGLACALVTNGTLAKPDLAPTLVERGLDRLNVSLNAGSREVYHRSNNKDLWDKALEFLRTVLGGRKKRNSQRPWVRISNVITRDNYEDMDNMVRTIVELGADEADFYVMGELPGNSHLQLGKSERNAVLDRIEDLAGVLDGAGVAHSLPLFAEDVSARARGGAQQDNPLQRKLPCYIGWTFCVIGPDGVVVPCCYCEETVLGNVYEESFARIWRGALYKKFRKASLDIPNSGIPICKECFVSCNRAIENRWIFERLHPFGRHIK
jgi:radical SAM protein with 4Fe4S-binding SPASM domain